MNWQAAVERTVTGLGYDLVDTEWSGRGLLRVYIDRLPAAPGVVVAASEAFIQVEDCEKVTRQLQHVLEVENCAYERLEVSSPGLDRPLKKPADYARFAGEQIEVTLKMPFQGRKRYSGVLHAAEAEAAGGVVATDAWRLVFTDENKVEQAFDFTLPEVREARLVPVLDFKGRRFAPVVENPGEGDEAPAAERSDERGDDEQVDGGRKE